MVHSRHRALGRPRTVDPSAAGGSVLDEHAVVRARQLEVRVRRGLPVLRDDQVAARVPPDGKAVDRDDDPLGEADGGDPVGARALRQALELEEDHDVVIDPTPAVLFSPLGAIEGVVLVLVRGPLGAGKPLHARGYWPL